MLNSLSSIMLEATIVSETSELEQILELQKLYLRGRTSELEEMEQGFLSVEYSMDLLHKMHRFEPSIIVKDGSRLAGYALVITRECRASISVLDPMFAYFNQFLYGERPGNEFDFYVMAQICVAKDYRGQGVFDLLYDKHKEKFQHVYDFVITEISNRNRRSLRAHQRTGFHHIHIHTHQDNTDEWSVVLWDWTPDSKNWPNSQLKKGHWPTYS